jgi:hypothetical protein
MPTAKQTAFDRTSSQKSTAPPITAAHAASRYNAAKHGIVATTQIMFDESAEDLADLAAEYHEHHNPADPKERFLVDTLVNNEWRIRRLRRTESELWDHATNIFMATNTEVPACTSGDAFATAAPTFERLQRVANSCERIYHRALKELQAKVGQALSPANPDALPQPPQAETAPAPAAAPPQPEQSKPTSEKLGSFRQNPKTPPAAASKPPATPPPAAPIASQPAPPSPTETNPRPVPDPNGSN